jgi:hypothetical protein
MAAGMTGRVDVIGTVPTIWSREVLRYTMPNLELWSRITKRFGNGFNVGDTLQIPTYNDTAVTPNTGDTAVVREHTGSATGFSGSVEEAGTTHDPVYVAQTVGSVKVYISEWFYFAAEVTAYAEATAQGDLIDLFKSAGLDSLGVQIDTSVAGLIAGLTAAVGVDNVPLTDDLILDGIKTLDVQNVKGQRHFVFSAEEKANFMKIEKYVNALTRGDPKPVNTGDLGDLYGMMWAMSTNVAAGSSGHVNALFHEDTFAGVMRRDPASRVAELPDPMLSQRIICMAIWGVDMIRDRFGLEMRGL